MSQRYCTVSTVSKPLPSFLTVRTIVVPRFLVPIQGVGFSPANPPIIAAPKASEGKRGGRKPVVHDKTIPDAATQPPRDEEDDDEPGPSTGKKATKTKTMKTTKTTKTYEPEQIGLFLRELDLPVITTLLRNNLNIQGEVRKQLYEVKGS